MVVQRIVLSTLAACALAPALQRPAAAQATLDVDGMAIEVRRLGNGGPTVVFESGISRLAIWGSVPERVAEFTSTLSYSHPGIGASGPAQAPRSALRVAEELRRLLRAAKVEPPLILVGHSMGGLYARVYAMTYPGDVAGLVLVDGSHERQVREFTRLDSNFRAYREQALRGLDPPAMAEMAGLAPILETGELGIPGKLPDVPMVVLTSTRSAPAMIPGAAQAFRDLNAEIFRATTYGMHIVTSRSGHLIQRDEPDLVVSAIRWVYDAIQRKP